ncbi:MAG: cache domain-containing protein [Caldilineaceae bacterium]|nr:cache domain-containing protein [Caldilineaceae bacterium]
MYRATAFLLTLALALVVAGCVAIPSRNDPAAYTQSIVQDAIRRYQREGRQAAIDYHSSTEKLDGQWYVFIIGLDGYTIAHYNPEIVGRDPALRVDSTGYFFGDDLLSATEEGKWVSYLAPNPETGEEARKHAWVVRHDDLFFGSGWYEEE